MMAFLAALSIALARSPDTLDTHHVAADKKVLRSCGPVDRKLADLPAKNWTVRDNELQNHKKLREALGTVIAAAPSMVLVYASGGHLATKELSVVLRREPDGHWTGNAVERSRIWVADAPYTSDPPKAWVLPRDGGRRLDAMLKDRCLYAEPTEFPSNEDGPPPLGILSVQMDIITPDRQRHVAFMGGAAKGLTADILSLTEPK